MSNKVCIECNEDNPLDSLYCHSCGRRFINKQFYDLVRYMANKRIVNNIKRENEAETTETVEDLVKLLEFKVEVTVDPNVIKEYTEKLYPVLEESIMLNYNFSDEVKKGLIHDLIDGMNKQLMPYDKARNMSKRLNGNMELAEKIEHAEVMRSANMSSWIQAKGEGLKYFTIDFCNNEGCIDKYKYKYFDIDDIEDIPPIYSDCGCVPSFHFDVEDAETWGREISEKNLKEYAEERKKYEEPYAKGYIAFNLAEDKIKNLNEVNAENYLYLQVIPLLKKAFLENISDNTKARVYRMLGDIYYKNDNVERAVENYEKALSINPKIGVKRLYDKLTK